MTPTRTWPARSRRLGPLLLAGLLLWPALSLADPRIEARRHFRNGMSLISSGDFDRGIAELREAYAIKPHPNVLYNIARAYLDAGNVAEAQEYYRRYLAANPPDSEQVRATLARLEEATAPKPQPQSPRPEPPKGKPGAVVASAAMPAVDPETVRRLNELMGRLELAVTKAEGLSHKLGEEQQPQAQAAANPARPGREEEEDTSAVPYEETVVTASRRAQSTLEAPNATAIITADEIRMSGATTLVDLLRRVPGAEVMVMGVGSANVSMRGFNQRIANKVLVLVDGRTEYQDFLGLTVWSALPVGLDEIERIEVIRGPGSALYGANAMLGVINIITKSPGAGTSTVFTSTGGSGNSAYATFMHSAAQGGLRFRASGAFSQTDKWSRDYADDRSDITPQVTETSLGLRSARANLTARYDFNKDFSVSLSGGANRLFTEIYPLGLLRNFFFDGLSTYAKADVGAGPLKLKLFWNHLEAIAGLQYAAIGERSVASSPQSNVFNGELLWQNEFTLLGEHLLNAGIEGRLKRVSWSYLGDLHEELHLAGFVQDEWKIVQPFRIVASYRVDRHPLLDNGSPGYALSPRISAVYIPWEGHAFRAGYATAFREPTFLESYMDIRIPVPGVTGASALTIGSTSLKPEELTAYELGYRGEFPIIGLEWDLAVYQNAVKDLIDIGAMQRLAAGQAFDPVSQTFILGRSAFQNEPGVYTARGIEVAAKYSPLDGLSITASGSYQAITASEVDTACIPCGQAPAFKAFLGASYRSAVGFDFSVDGAYTSATTFIEREPAQADPTQIAFIPYPLSEYYVVNARIAYRFFQDRATLALVGTNLGGGHQEHPFGNEISRRFFATLTVTP